jgi:hypothetical protein
VEQYLVVASTTWSHDWAISHDSSDADLFGCAATLGIPRDTARAFLEARPWRAFDAEVGGSAYVLFQAMPNDTPTAICARGRLHDARYLQRGILLATGSQLNAGNNVSDIDVFADAEFVSPTIYGRVPVAATDWDRSPPTSLRRPVLRQVRVYLPMEAIDPHAGRFPDIVLRVWNDYLKLIAVPIPGTLTRQLWRELVPWRLEHGRSVVVSESADVPAVPTPNDAVLRAAVDRYRRGEVVDGAEQAAAWRALDRARSRGVDSAGGQQLHRDRLIADVMVGGVLAAARDTVAAAPLADDALAASPCLVSTVRATSTYAMVLTNRRPKVRCSTLPLSTIARRGLLFPGGGHSVAQDNGRAAAATTVVGVALGGALAATVAASQRYKHYKEATTVERAQQRYTNASSMRDLATGLAIGGAAMWLADMGYAVVREKRHTASVRAQASFGRDGCGSAGLFRCAR